MVDILDVRKHQGCSFDATAGYCNVFAVGYVRPRLTIPRKACRRVEIAQDALAYDAIASEEFVRNAKSGANIIASVSLSLGSLQSLQDMPPASASRAQ
jgi:hypothetical protein